MKTSELEQLRFSRSNPPTFEQGGIRTQRVTVMGSAPPHSGVASNYSAAEASSDLRRSAAIEAVDALKAQDDTWTVFLKARMAAIVSFLQEGKTLQEIATILSCDTDHIERLVVVNKLHKRADGALY